MSNINYSDTIPAAPSGSTNMKWQFDSNGNVSASLPVASFSTPWTSDMDANTHKLSNVGTITSQVTGATPAFATPSNTATITGAGDATFKTVNGPAASDFSILAANNLEFFTSSKERAYFNPTGTLVINVPDSGPALATGSSVSATGFSATASGASLAFATPANAATITGAGDATFHGVTTNSGVLVQMSAGNLWGLIITQGAIGDVVGPRIVNVNGKSLNLAWGGGGAIGSLFCDLALNLNAEGGELSLQSSSFVEIETSGNKQRVLISAAGNVTINAPDSGTALTVAGPTSLTGAGGIFSITNLPSVAPAAGSKQLYYDPADGNRVKFAV